MEWLWGSFRLGGGTDLGSDFKMAQGNKVPYCTPNLPLSLSLPFPEWHYSFPVCLRKGREDLGALGLLTSIQNFTAQIVHYSDHEMSFIQSLQPLAPLQSKVQHKLLALTFKVSIRCLSSKAIICLCLPSTPLLRRKRFCLRDSALSLCLPSTLGTASQE